MSNCLMIILLSVWGGEGIESFISSLHFGRGCFERFVRWTPVRLKFWKARFFIHHVTCCRNLGTISLGCISFSTKLLPRKNAFWSKVKGTTIGISRNYFMVQLYLFFLKTWFALKEAKLPGLKQQILILTSDLLQFFLLRTWQYKKCALDADVTLFFRFPYVVQFRYQTVVNLLTEQK